MLSYKNKKQLSTLALCLIVVVLLAYHLAYFGRIYPGVNVAGIDLGNKTKNQALNILFQEIQVKKPNEIVISASNKTWNISLSELELSYDIERDVNLACQIGRNKNPFRAYLEKWQAWKGEINLPSSYSLNQSALEEKIEEISQAIFIPAIEPQIKISGKQIIIDPGKDGQEADLKLLQEKIKSNLFQLSSESISLSIIYTTPKLSPQQLEKTKERAEKFLDKKIELVLGGESQTLTEKDLIDLVSPWDGFDQEKISSLAANLSSAFNRPPQNAAFQFSEGKVVIFKPAKEGIKIDEEKLKSGLLSLLEKIEKDKIKEETLSIPFAKIPPLIKTGDVNTLGIKELLGKGESFFRGSIASRIHNITLASSRLNGILISPGETFSFNRLLGEVSQTTGYQEAYVIREGRTILGDGGGVCQVSTTLFRAVLAAGLPIEERHPHAYRVSYYEQGFPPGLDATVWDPTADLKFKNDTPAYILIQTLVDTKNKKLVFELYGASDGRISEIGKSKVWDQVPPPPDLYQDDPTLPSGQIKQIDWKAWGAKVAFDWKVKRGGEVLQERTFYSNYQPWQAIFLRGTGPTP